MKITLIELRNVYLQLYKAVLSFFNEIEIVSDYYWCTAADERENLDKKPTLCLGSLVDDWAELKKITQREFATLVDVQRFANILISIGEIVQQKSNVEKTYKISKLENFALKISPEELVALYPYIEDAIFLIVQDKIDFPYDLYWTTLPNEREKTLADPKLSIGSLKNDWCQLQNILHNKEAIADDLNRFANVLISTSEIILRKS